jgi:hypothetical protein
MTNEQNKNIGLFKIPAYPVRIPFITAQECQFFLNKCSGTFQSGSLQVDLMLLQVKKHNK